MAQPNMGRRKQYVTRVPMTVAVPFAADVAASGLTASMFIADLLAVKYGAELPSVRFACKRAQQSRAMRGYTLDLALPAQAEPTGGDVVRAVSDGEDEFETYSTRLPEDIVTPVEHDATEAGLSYSHFIATVIAARYGVELPAERFAPKRLTLVDQEVLPLERAS